MTPEEINKMTGAESMNRPTLKRRKAIRLNGKTGKIIITHLDKDKVRDDSGNEKYQIEEMTGELNLVFLKVRRRLMQGSPKDGIIKYTDEHDTLNDIVTLYIKDGGKETGPASQLREAHPELKTEQIIYCRWKGEVVKLSVKGLSLRGSDDTTNFYQYISAGNDWYKRMTTLTAHEDSESGYWFFDFKAGNDLSTDQVEEVIENIKEVHEDCEKVKESIGVNAPVAAPTEVVPDKKSDYPTTYSDGEEITPEDIPF